MAWSTRTGITVYVVLIIAISVLFAANVVFICLPSGWSKSSGLFWSYVSCQENCTDMELTDGKYDTLYRMSVCCQV